jgi:hypothetical protein
MSGDFTRIFLFIGANTNMKLIQVIIHVGYHLMVTLRDDVSLHLHMGLTATILLCTVDSWLYVSFSFSYAAYGSNAQVPFTGTLITRQTSACLHVCSDVTVYRLVYRMLKKEKAQPECRLLF